MILYLVIGAVVGFAIGVFVYRNNVDVISPIADKVDGKFDKLEARIEELKNKIDSKIGGKDDTDIRL